MLDLEPESLPLGAHVEDFKTGSNDFGSDAVARDGGNFICAHGRFLGLSWRSFASMVRAMRSDDPSFSVDLTVRAQRAKRLHA
jgi:hypothetical protein